MSTENENPTYDLEGAFPIDVDFETYEVPAERAQSIRQDLQEIKSKTWLSGIFGWIKEKGHPIPSEDLLGGESPGKELRWPEDHSLKELVLTLDGTIVEVSLTGKNFLVLQQFPKSEEILISHYNSSLAESFIAIELALQEELKTFTKTKAEKAKAFAAKFEK